MTTFQGRVFGIGLPKTGSYSLFRACDILGIPSIHHWRENRQRLNELSKQPGQCQAIFPSGTAYFDGELYKHWSLLMRLFPNDRFILHDRSSMERWINSKLVHVLYNRTFGEEWQWLDTDQSAIDWEMFHAETEHLAEQPNVLVFNLSAGDGWKELCEFLDRPIPDVAFPQENTSAWRLAEVVQHYQKLSDQKLSDQRLQADGQQEKPPVR